VKGNNGNNGNNTGRNPKKSLEGIKTPEPSAIKARKSTVETLRNPWKGLKLKTLQSPKRLCSK